MTKQDSLTTLFAMQKLLQEKAYSFNFDVMSTEERVKFIKEMSIHLNQEVNEMLYELPFFKPWKDYSNMTEVEKDLAFIKAKKEFVDVLHFFLNIGIALGFTSDELTTAYKVKNEENYQRQLDGYTHDKQYR